MYNKTTMFKLLKTIIKDPTRDNINQRWACAIYDAKTELNVDADVSLTGPYFSLPPSTIGQCLFVIASQKMSSGSTQCHCEDELVKKVTLEDLRTNIVVGFNINTILSNEVEEHRREKVKEENMKEEKVKKENMKEENVKKEKVEEDVATDLPKSSIEEYCFGSMRALHLTLTPKYGIIPDDAIKTKLGGFVLDKLKLQTIRDEEKNYCKPLHYKYFEDINLLPTNTTLFASREELRTTFGRLYKDIPDEDIINLKVVHTDSMLLATPLYCLDEARMKAKKQEEKDKQKLVVRRRQELLQEKLHKKKVSVRHELQAGEQGFFQSPDALRRALEPRFGKINQQSIKYTNSWFTSTNFGYWLSEYFVEDETEHNNINK